VYHLQGAHHASLHLTRKLFRGLPAAEACFSMFWVAVSLGTSITEACISWAAGRETAG